MKLPGAPASYSQADQASMRMLIEAEDRRTLKNQGDIVLTNGLRIVGRSPNGNLWEMGVSNAGATTWTLIS